MIRRFLLPLLFVPTLSACAGGVPVREVIDATRAVSCEICQLSGGDPREVGAAHAEALRRLTEAIAEMAIRQGADRAWVEAQLAKMRARWDALRADFDAISGAPK